MNSVFWGNFDFEHELMGPRYSPNRSLQRINAELSCHLMGLADSGDAVCLPELPPADFVAAFQQKFQVSFECLGWPLAAPRGINASDRDLQPWGWSNAARLAAARLGVAMVAPEDAAVRSANSRRVSVELERELGLALAGSRVIGSVSDVREAVIECSRQSECSVESVRWVVKAEFGMSARERVVGTGPKLPAPTRGWIEKRLRAGEWLVFEPWLDRVGELGILFEIQRPELHSPEAARVDLITVTELLTNSSGQYVGSMCWSSGTSRQFEGSPKIVAQAVTEATRFVNRIARTGYFGPIGIDAMIYRSVDGELALRPIQDVNARRTMGFIAHNFARRAARQQLAAWLFAKTSRIAELYGVELDRDVESCLARSACSQLDVPLPSRAGNAIAIRTSPLWLGDQPTRQTAVLVTADSMNELDAARQFLTEENS